MGIIKKFAKILGFILGASVFLATCNAYFVTKFDPVNKMSYDGFGRLLTESPFFVRIIFGQERFWAGWSWFIADLIIFWGGVGVAWLFIDFGFKDDKIKK